MVLPPSQLDVSARTDVPAVKEGFETEGYEVADMRVMTLHIGQSIFIEMIIYFISDDLFR